MRILIFLCTAICLLSSCNNDEVLNTVEEIDTSTSSLTIISQESSESSTKLKNYLKLECEENFDNYATRSTESEFDHFLENFDFGKQEVIKDELNRNVFMVKNNKNNNLLLCFYEDEAGNILNIKLVETSFDDVTGNVKVSFKRIDGTEYVSLGGNIENSYFGVESYNRDVFGDVTNTRAHSVGCSAAITAAGIPWTVGFGMVNPVAGIIATVVFWGMSELMCG